MSNITSTYPSSSSSSSSPLSGLFAERTPGLTLDSQSIEEIMEEVYAVAYGPESQASQLEAVSKDRAFPPSLQKAHPWSSSQQQIESPKVIFVVYTVHGQEVLQPMVPIRKCDYFDMEAFERAQQQRPVCDVVRRILREFAEFDLTLLPSSPKFSGASPTMWKCLLKLVLNPG